MIWTSILLLTCQVIATIGAKKDYDYTKEVQDSDWKVKAQADNEWDDTKEVQDIDWKDRAQARLRTYSYARLYGKNQEPVHSWSKLGRTPTYSYKQQNWLADSWDRKDKQSYQSAWNRQNRLQPSRNSWLQGLREDNQKQDYSWNREARQKNLNQVYSVASQHRGNPDDSYSRINQHFQLDLNQNRQAPEYWKDSRLEYDNPSFLWDVQAREGSKKYYEWNIPTKNLNSLKRKDYPVKLQDTVALYKNPGFYLNRENLYDVPVYTTSGLNPQQLNRGALEYNRVPYALGKRQGKKYSNSWDSLKTNELWNVNAARQNSAAGAGNWGKLDNSWG